MLTNIKSTLIIGLVGASIGSLLTLRLRPPKTLVQTQEKVVTQDVVRTVTRIVKEPSGVTTIVKESTKVSEKKADKVTSVSVPTKSSVVAQYRATALFTPTFDPYAVGVERRVLGPVWAGVQVQKPGNLLFSLAWEF